jgi:uncharacterized membrane protein YgcG
VRRGRGIAVVALALLAVVCGGAARAGASVAGTEHINSYDVDVTIQPNGDIVVVEKIDYDFGVVPKHGIFRDIPTRIDYPPRKNHDRVYPLEVLSVRASEGTPAQYEVSTEGDNERIKIGDPDRTITGTHTYEITYRVEGAMNGFVDRDELVWNAIGTQWSVPIDSANVVVHAPAAILGAGCAAGSYGSNSPCGSASVNGDTATFSGPSNSILWSLGPFQGMTVSIALPKGVVPEPKPILEERWTFASAFRVTPATGGLAGGLLLLLACGVVLVVWLLGRDRRFKGSAVDAAFVPDSANAPEERVPLFGEHETPVEFVPPDGLRPGQVGTIVDFHANALDVTATIVDLAVRGYLVIEEIDAPGRFHRGDWKLTRKKEDDTMGRSPASRDTRLADGSLSATLLPYETKLLDGLFRDGDEVTLSGLRYEFATRMNNVREELQDDAKSRGWFASGAGGCAVFALGLVVALLGVGLTVALAIWTHAALVGVPVIIGGVLLMIGARWVPRRTAKGYAVLRHVDGFRRFIEESEKQRAQFAEKKNLFTEYLPYAIVFGATEKWAHAFAGLDDQPPDTGSWYISQHAFNYALFSSAIGDFAVASAGTLASTPPSTSGSSGFSGGGFSGGGGGGGGGGSW